MKSISRYAGLALVTLLLTACASTGEETVAKAAIEDPDKVTCRTVVKTGTRIGAKVCKTNRAWAVSTAYGRKMVDDVTRKALNTQTISGN